MTHLEFHKLPCTLLSHISLDTGCLAVYNMETPKGGVRIEAYTRKRKNGDYGKSSRVYIFRGKEYKTIDELLKDYNGTK